MKQRSLFWPLALIGAGLIWLLVSMGTIPSTNLWALAQLFPYLLMALGLALLIRVQWPAAGWIVSLLVVAGAVLAVFFAPQLGWNRPVGWALGFGDFGFSGAVPGSGMVKTETRTPADFTSLEVRYPSEITIRQGNSPALEIQAEDNLLPQISTEVRCGRLVIRSEEIDWAARVKPSKPVKITLTVKDLNELIFSGAGTVNLESLKSDHLKVVLSGAGEIKLAKLDLKSLDGVLSGAGTIKADGRADNVDLIVSGLGSFEAPALQSLSASIRISGSGSATLRVKDELNATVSGAGTINYYGSPQITRQISGAGSVKSLGK
jgi:hypothetical protein